jgi:hypothetical protein
MPDQQTSINTPEPKSYDGDLFADVRSAVEESTTRAAEPAVIEKPPPAEPKIADTPKTEPEAAKADHPTDEKRYADGTFKPVKGEEKPGETKPAEIKTDAAKPTEGVKVETPPVGTQAPVTAPAAGAPPHGWSVKSKADWDKLPEHIRADVVKREQEVNAGFAEYGGMKELRPYVEMARSQGTTLKDALDRYTGIERSLRQQPLQAILHIAGNAGISPQRLAMELAPYAGLQQSDPAQQQPGLQPPELLQHYLNPVLQEVSGLKSLFQAQQEAERTRQMSAVNTVLERFAADPAHRYFHNVEAQMTQLFESGVVPRTGDYAADVQKAYDTACRMDMEISEALYNQRIAETDEARKKAEKEAAEKAKLASRSLTGSPSTGPVKADDKGGDSIEDDVRRAYRSHAA